MKAFFDLRILTLIFAIACDIIGNFDVRKDIKQPSMTAKNNKISAGTLFEERVGTCIIAMCLDKRHPESVNKNSFPLCVRFTIYNSRYYYRLGEKCTIAELTKLSKTQGNREKHVGTETTFERKVRLQEVFSSMVNVVTVVSERGVLTLDRIKVALTGRCETASFLSVWEDIIAEKRRIGKAGTAENYEEAMKNFKRHTGFTYADGFAVDSALINKWVEGMTAANTSASTQGIKLRACRVVVNRCIGEGYMMPKAYMFGKSRDKVKIPVGSSRKNRYLTVNQMTELYIHWKNRDVSFPIHNSHRQDNPSYAVKTEKSRDLIYQSLAMFLMQYLCCGCNLIDLALMRYNRFYFECNGRAFQFIRHKTEDETKDGDGMEVIVPITQPMREILAAYSSKPKENELVFPFLMEEAVDVSAMKIRRKICDQNKNISNRMEKLMDAIGWSVNPTGTYARHSFATNLHTAKVPMEYISDAMGHSLGNRGQITIRYISPYTIEDRMKYNEMLLNLGENQAENVEEKQQSTIALTMEPGKQAILEKMHSFSEKDLKEALLMLKRKELAKLEAELSV